MSQEATKEAASAPIDINQVMALIPHRPPFLLVDRAEAYVANTSIVGIKAVTVNEPFFEGHFPGFPVMPGVLIVEAMAQTSAILMSKSLAVEVAGKTIMFMSVDNCRFRAPVRPGDMLRLEVEVVQARGVVFKFKGQALVDGKRVAQAEWAAMVVDTPA
jgi:3-hydroxyacyl-[acyl-carrier-protein] dehydratase